MSCEIYRKIERSFQPLHTALCRNRRRAAEMQFFESKRVRNRLKVLRSQMIEGPPLALRLRAMNMLYEAI